MSITRHHNEWLSLVPNSGPFLSLPVLAQAFPQGLDAHDAEHARRLRLAFDEWDDNQLGQRPDPGIHRAWVKFVVGESLRYDELLAKGQEIPQTLKSDVAEYGETLRPDWIVNDPATKKARLLVQVYPRSQSLTKPVASSRWKTSPDTRMMQLLHDTGIRLGIVTNGDHWMLVNAPRNETTGYASWYANLWLEEPVTLRALRTVLGADRLFSVPEGETLEALLDKSSDDQQEVTDQLGYQVRKAVEVLIQALDKADQDHGRTLLTDVDEKVLYESALTVMMRLVFLFCAEERELLLLGDDLYDKNYAVSTLREQLEVARSEHSDDILNLRYDAWTRLLTTFRAVYAGAKHDRLKLPAYGGNLFNPDRFPFLEGRKFGTSWKNTEATPLPVSNRTVLHLLEALQVLQVRLPGGGAAEARKLSFRALDIEQIGHVYEGLLDHTAKRATEPVLGLQGTRDREPEIALAELEHIAAKGEKELLEFLKDATGRSTVNPIKKALKAELDDQLVSRFRTACQDSDLWKRVKPFVGLVRLDTVGYPVVITKGSVFVTAGTDRRSSGTHYTPKSLTEPIVQYTLEPLVYVGPAEGLPKDQWTLRSAKELLDLKVCDMACGSGAFLVQACRYLSERLLEAWGDNEATAQRRTQLNLFGATPQIGYETVRITPYGQPSQGGLYEQLVPLDPDERQTYALRIVAQRCLYGVDKNPLAVEMAKLSLWLLTLAKDKPFEFLDHAIRCGDSLVGIHNLDQLRKFNLDGKGEDNRLFLLFLDQKIKEAIALRRQITEMQANTVEDVEAQDRMLREANEKIDRLKCAADLLLSAEFVPGSAADKRAARDDAAIKVAVHFNDSELPTFRRESRKGLAGQVTFHWPLEFPEVIVERGGFDVFVGNPPFMHGSWISSRFGDRYADVLRELTSGVVGKVDYVVYFLRRAALLARNGGTIGLLLTDKATEGDARKSGLQWLVENGFSVFHSKSNIPWPGAAGVLICMVNLYKGKWLAPINAAALNSQLEEDAPCLLLENEGTVYQGAKPDSLGFVVDVDIAQALLKGGNCASVLRPYYSGSDLNDLPVLVPPRYVIDFSLHDLDDARRHPSLLQIIEREVKPKRLTLKRKAYRDRWWQFTEPQLALFAAIRQHPLALAVSRVSKHFIFRLVPTDAVYSGKVIVYSRHALTDFAILSSSFHLCWAVHFGGTHGSGTPEYKDYKPTECGRTFPFPRMSDGLKGNLEGVGRGFNEVRDNLFVQRACGPTALYNRFHDADEASDDIQQLRQLHVEMDDAVAAAYGWTDLDLGHGFHETKQGVRYTISEAARREVLARLLKLNHERHAEELTQALHEKKKPKGKKTKANTQAGPTLFPEEEDA
jgi:N-6 DNA Methylase